MKNRAISGLLTLLLVSGLCSQWGCASNTRVPEYSSASAATPVVSAHVKAVEHEGLKVTLDPFSDKARCETYFKLNAPAAGIVILHLRVENQSAETTWLVRKSQLHLVVAGSASALVEANTKQDTGAGEALAITGAALAGLATTPLFLALGGSQIKHATTVQRNFTEKELRDRTLSPGQSEEGFIYYQLAKKNSSFSGTLLFGASSTQNQQSNILQIPIEYEVQ